MNKVLYFEAIGYKSLPERDKEVTRQKDSIKRILDERFHRRTLERAKCA
jgi:hypothetical protein